MIQKGIWITHICFHHWRNSFCVERVICIIMNSESSRGLFFSVQDFSEIAFSLLLNYHLGFLEVFTNYFRLSCLCLTEYTYLPYRCSERLKVVCVCALSSSHQYSGIDLDDYCYFQCFLLAFQHCGYQSVEKGCLFGTPNG